jgi:hypothetical protein
MPQKIKVLLAGLIVILPVFSECANASIKNLDCNMYDHEDGGEKVLKVIIDDKSNKAEVLRYSEKYECAKDQSCKAELFEKEVLPTTIRLSLSKIKKWSSYIEVIDIDRFNLQVVNNLRINVDEPQNIKVDQTWLGECSLKEVRTKKLI